MATYPCPVCLAEANLETGCPACGRAPDPLAAEVIVLDTAIARLAHEVDAAREAYEGKAAELRTTRDRRRDLALRVWESAHPAPVPPVVPMPRLVVAGPPPARPEARTQTVKNILFVLGGLLVAVSAAVFTVFAWGTFGMPGRATILAVVTGLALAAPVLAQRRGLRGTAETFAALGLVLVLLDGYAAWHVDLLGVAERMGAWAYAGAVFGIAAALAGLYARATGLRAPAYFGWAAVQPVLPMLLSGAVNDHGGLVFAGVAALNLALAAAVRDRVLVVLGWIGFGFFLFVAHVYAVVRLVQADTVAPAGRAAAVLLVAGALAVAGSLVAHRAQIGVAWFTAVFVGCGARLADILAPGHTLVWTAALVCVLALGFALLNRLPASAGAIAWTVVIGLTAAAGAIVRGLTTATAATPWWSGTPAGGPAHADLFVTVILATAAAVALSARRAPAVAIGVGILGVGLLAPTAAALAPGSAALPPAADVAGLAIVLGYLVLWTRGRLTIPATLTGSDPAAALAPPAPAPTITAPDPTITAPAAAVAAPAPRATAPALTIAAPAPELLAAAVVGTALFAHAMLTAMISPAVSAWSFAALVALAVIVAALTRTEPQAAVAVAVTAPLLVLTAAATAKALGAGPSAVLHTAALTAALLPALAMFLRRGAVTAWATALVMVFAGVLVLPADPWVKSFYVAGGLLALAVDRQRERRLATWCALAVALVLARPPVTAFFGGPATFADAAAFAVLTLAITIHVYAYRGDRRTALGFAVALAPLPVTFALAAAEVAGQVVAGELAVAGLTIMVAALLRARPQPLHLVAAGYGVLLAAAGLPRLMITPWWTVAGLGLLTAAFVVLAVAAGHSGTRWAAWPLAGLGWLATGQAAAAAARWTGHERLLTLVATALVLLAVGVLGPRRLLWVEAVSLEPLGHAAAAGALVWAYPMGVVSQVLLVWGVAVGLTALALPRWRLPRAAVAVGLELAAWWSLLAERHIVTVEAYSLPVALAGLGLGWWAMRRDETLSSWAGYAPGLLAGLLPTLTLAVVGEGEPLRRLGVALAGLALVIAGSVRRRQAPVVLGGGALILLALHELVVAWANLGRPVWLPLGAGGAILLAIAITYERRLRDLRTLRARIGRYR
ncbi:SCO7613 C-terminal domain-containing membrane protein [Hamadaea tsunoensis]|uniref:SCO7613 C-terminal domain-containing membrane protein n=1 Tax=Hamadaea tsunoensis TaxID=53368 RepID=UPI00040633FA|nr:hypothetical protein [Hamadaea tsunoensis]